MTDLPDFFELEKLFAPRLRRLARIWRVEGAEVRSVAWLAWLHAKSNFKPQREIKFECYWLSILKAKMAEEFSSLRRTQPQAQVNDVDEAFHLDCPESIVIGCQQVNEVLEQLVGKNGEPQPKRKKICSPRHLRRLTQQARERAEEIMLAQGRLA